MGYDKSGIQNDIEVANRFLNRSYLNDLTNFQVLPIEEHQKRFQSIRLYRINKLIYDSNEDVNDKLISVFNSVQNTRSNLVMILCGKSTSVEFYIGVQSMHEIGIADKVFQKSMLGNFPGSLLQRIEQSEVVLTLFPLFEMKKISYRVWKNSLIRCVEKNTFVCFWQRQFMIVSVKKD